VSAFNLVGGAPTKPRREVATTATCPAATWRAAGAPCPAASCSLRFGLTPKEALTAVNPTGSSRVALEVVLMAQIIGREAAAGCKR